jgi:hypothetical protein
MQCSNRLLCNQPIDNSYINAAMAQFVAGHNGMMGPMAER